MTRVDEFDSFYNASFDSVMQVTYAVCGDRQQAREATSDAFGKAWRNWSKIRESSTLSYVRDEAYRAASLNRSTQLLRRKPEQSPDPELFEALAKLSTDQRRLLVLMTVGNTDLEAASREVGVRAEDGIEMATDALSALESSTGQSIGELETRLLGLAATPQDQQHPPAAQIRQSARRGGQRNTILLAIAAVIVMLGSGYLVTATDASARQDALPQREKLGSEGADIVLDARDVTESDLLTAAQVSRLNPRATWQVDGTDPDLQSTQPYATCPTQRFGDPDPLRVFVRQFSAPEGNARVAESVEISRSSEASKKGAETVMSWFANCAHPRVQLISANKVDRPFGDFIILKLRANRSPQRIFTVGFAQSGTISSTVVHEADGTKGPNVDAFAQVLNDSLSKICTASGAQCLSEDVSVETATPPATENAPAFLGVVDLPPIKDINRVWAAVPVKSNPNRAATPCDNTKFTSKKIKNPASRIFLLFKAAEVPKQFGVTQTMGQFKSNKAAKDFVTRMSNRIETCADRNPTAQIEGRSSANGPQHKGKIWRVGVEAGDSMAYYRTAVVRRGSTVSQITLVTAKGYDMDRKTFAALVDRAATRLKYAK